jgi:hypothetical protein
MSALARCTIIDAARHVVERGERARPRAAAAYSGAMPFARSSSIAESLFAR